MNNQKMIFPVGLLLLNLILLTVSGCIRLPAKNNEQQQRDEAAKASLEAYCQAQGYNYSLQDVHAISVTEYYNSYYTDYAEATLTLDGTQMPIIANTKTGTIYVVQDTPHAKEAAIEAWLAARGITDEQILSNELTAHICLPTYVTGPDQAEKYAIKYIEIDALPMGTPDDASLCETLGDELYFSISGDVIVDDSISLLSMASLQSTLDLEQKELVDYGATVKNMEEHFLKEHLEFDLDSNHYMRYATLEQDGLYLRATDLTKTESYKDGTITTQSTDASSDLSQLVIQTNGKDISVQYGAGNADQKAIQDLDQYELYASPDADYVNHIYTFDGGDSSITLSWVVTDDIAYLAKTGANYTYLFHGPCELKAQ